MKQYEPIEIVCDYGDCEEGHTAIEFFGRSAAGGREVWCQQCHSTVELPTTQLSHIDPEDGRPFMASLPQQFPDAFEEAPEGWGRRIELPDDINPGIRRAVTLFRALGYETTDSGDGETHDHDCDREHAYVAIILDHEDDIGRQGDELAEVVARHFTAELRPLGVTVGDGRAVAWLQIDYDPVMRIALAHIIGVSDKNLRG